MNLDTQVSYPLSYGFEIATDGLTFGFTRGAEQGLTSQLKIDGKILVYNQDKNKENSDVADIKAMIIDLVKQPKLMQVQKKACVNKVTQTGAGQFLFTIVADDTQVIALEENFVSDDYYKAFEKFLYPYITVEVKKNNRTLYFNDLSSMLKNPNCKFLIGKDENVQIILTMDNDVNSTKLEGIKAVRVVNSNVVVGEELGTIQSALINEIVSERVKNPTTGLIKFRCNLKLFGTITNSLGLSK